MRRFAAVSLAMVLCVCVWPKVDQKKTLTASEKIVIINQNQLLAEVALKDCRSQIVALQNQAQSIEAYLYRLDKARKALEQSVVATNDGPTTKSLPAAKVTSGTAVTSPTK